MGNWPDFGTPWGPHLCLARRRFVGTLDTQAAGIGGLQQCSRWSCNVRNEDVLFRCPYGTGTLCKSGGDAKSLCHLGLERLIVSEKGANSGGIWYLDMFCFQQINTHTHNTWEGCGRMRFAGNYTGFWGCEKEILVVNISQTHNTLPNAVRWLMVNTMPCATLCAVHMHV